MHKNWINLIQSYASDIALYNIHFLVLYVTYICNTVEANRGLIRGSEGTYIEIFSAKKLFSSDGAIFSNKNQINFFPMKVGLKSCS